MSDSIWDDPTVTAFILGELSTAEAEAFEEKIKEDLSLAEVVAEARSVTNQLQIMYTEDASTTLEPTRRDAITEGNLRSSSVAKRSHQWRTPMVLLATAAALLLLLGSPYLFTPDSTVSSESTDPFSQETRDSEQDYRSTTSLAEMASEDADNQRRAPLVKNDNSNNGQLLSPQIKRFADSGGQRETDDSMGKSMAVDMDMDMGMDMDMEMGDMEGMGPGTGYGTPADGADGMESDDIFGGMFGASADAGRDSAKSGNTIEKKIGDRRPNVTSPQDKPLFYFDQDESEALVPANGATPAPGPMTTPRASTRARRSLADKAEMLGRTNSLLIPDLPFTKDNPGDQNRFNNLSENAFKRVSDAPLSTFSVDVDTASYSKVREYLLKQRRLPPVDAVRIEELVNYFNYEYLPPKDDAEYPFAAKAEIIACPWNDDHRLARIALKGKTMKPKNRPLSNLVFLLDTSGSMNSPNKLPLVKAGMNMLLSQLGENDRVAIVVYAGSAGLALDSTPATKTRKIEKALNTLAAGGSTNGGQGIQLAYQTARDNFIDGGVNRVILCTDGDFNVGTTGTGALVRMVEQEAAGNIFLSVLGFGMGNHNDSMLEQISGTGNGNYAFIDSQKEAQKVLVDQVSGTLVTIAKDVKLQIEFNPRMVSAYRLIGYENRVLAKEDFNNDKKDAGEIGAGHAVTALYELIPPGVQDHAVPPIVDDLKYQGPNRLTDAANGDESLTLKLRYKQPDGDTSKLVEFPVVDDETTFEDADHDARFAAAVASFGMQLRQSKYSGNWNMQNVIDTAKDSKGEDMSGLRAEFVEMAVAANKLKP